MLYHEIQGLQSIDPNDFSTIKSIHFVQFAVSTSFFLPCLTQNIDVYYKTIAAFFFLTFLSCSSDHSDSLSEEQGDFCDQIHRVDSISLSEILSPLESKMKEKTGVYVLEKGENAMISRAFLSEYAEESIDIQYFIFSTDNIGLIACDYLVRAADRGVKVRILIDDLMVDASIYDVLSLDAHENISIRIYNPGVNFGKNLFSKVKSVLVDFDQINHRMHNKTFIVDNKVVITGGRNIADEYFDYDHEYNFRDRDVLLLGKVTEKVKVSFEDFWMSELSMPVKELVDEDDIPKHDANRYERLHQYACNPANFWPEIRKKITQIPETFDLIQRSGDLIWVDDVKFISDNPGKLSGGWFGVGNTTKELMDLVAGAKKSIDIQSPYLVTTERSLKLFEEAVKRGVKIRILTNSLASTDNLEAFSGYQKIREDLLKTGVEIYEFRPDAKVRMDLMEADLQDSLQFKPIFGLHAKTMVVDDSISVVGTFNLDPRSAYLNSECITIIYSPKIAGSITHGMNIDILPENSWHTTPEFNPDLYGGKEKNVGTMNRQLIPIGIL